MTLQQIKYIIGVAKSGSLNKASKTLFISQPSLTTSVHDLEYELGFKIFKRSTQGISVTEKGEQFINDAQDFYKDYENLLKKYEEKQKKSFSVSTLYYAFARKAFIEVIKKFSSEGYDFSFREMKASEVIDDVQNQRSEVGIIYLNSPIKKDILKTLETKNIEFFHLTECKSFVYLYKNHPLAEKESISIDELSNYQFVTYDKNDLTSFFSDDFLQSHKLTQSITVADQATALSLLKSLNGYTFLSGIIGDKGDEDFIAVPIKNIDNGIRQNFELGYITQKNSKMSKLACYYIYTIKKILHLAGFAC